MGSSPVSAALRLNAAFAKARAGNYYNAGWYSYIDRRDIEACVAAVLEGSAHAVDPQVPLRMQPAPMQGDGDAADQELSAPVETWGHRVLDLQERDWEGSGGTALPHRAEPGVDVKAVAAFSVAALVTGAIALWELERWVARKLGVRP